MELVAFFVIAVVAVVSALGLVLRRNPIHGALFLVVNLGCVAVLYLLLGAEFLALAQVIIYAGAIMVLFVFAIMVLIPGKEETGPDPLRSQRLLALPLGALLLFEIGLILHSSVFMGAPHPGVRPGSAAPPTAAGGIQSVGRLLLGDYLLPFEVTSVLLLAALVGVLALAKRRAG
ncbi:MAG: NADH-ubiquinone/plastoquinone oxidoreductase subunit 6, NADH-quinone oxidoreductase subunit J [Candidatus Rokubacteria bacterium CSP1-6]|nr:MAG: NADH-ubiquinone/plastoquinone oxidoreductase subunit 6, NADH-quinone oxidoreductase subunit J [Candidatus Rokubacteria bacterium CSP1-6]